MVAVNPTWIDTVSMTGYFLRRSDSVLTMHSGAALSARSGVVPGTGGLNVTLSGSTITVSSGIAVVYYPGEGVFRAPMTSSSTLTLTAAHATLPRIDLVYLRVWCNSVDASGLNQADVVYLAGTASSTPAAPVPAGTQIYMPLATISVPASGGGSPTVSTAVRPYTVAPGGILPLQTSAPSSPYLGQFYDDQTNLRRWNGSSWETMAKVESVGWTTPTLAANYTTGDLTSNGNGNGPIRYRKYTDRGTDYMEWDGGAQRTAGSQVVNILSTALAASFRPAGRASFVIARNSVGIASGEPSVVHSCKIDFLPDGTVSLVAHAAGTSETTWFSLRGIRYPLA
ncbi:hypothetical protein [Streptomyces nymphaeiformis]|uniref:Uncharacterized protein n=1 Tax=Streptomyces nymphaeiformis TaxID=2663842 RepID=A0A7W7U4V8_9ACTN|nr:hypothetical protein [Streptomyces nymphaeiformis]MBB4985041.1 hypothetical protein [Streptomyces nymphaeiformis]